MVEAQVLIRTGVGLHARPAAALVGEARRHACALRLESGGRAADAKNILQVLALGVKDGEAVHIRAKGEGERQAVDALLGVLKAVSDGV